MSGEKFVEYYKKASRQRETLNRVDIHAWNHSARLKAGVSRLIAILPPLRFLVQVITPYSQLIGVKHKKTDELSE